MTHHRTLCRCALAVSLGLAAPLAFADTTQHLSRDQVRAERLQAQQAGEILAPGEAGVPRKYLNPAAIAGGPPDTAAPRTRFERGGANPWSIAYNPLRGFNSTASRSQVRQRYLQDREQVDALTSEDSGSAYLAAGQR